MNRRLGEILIDKGYLSEEQVMRALEIQLEESKEGMWVYIGEVLVKQGIVTKDQVEEGLLTVYCKTHYIHHLVLSGFLFQNLQA